MPTSPLSLARWQELIRRDADAAAHEVVRRIDALPPAQARAIFATRPVAATLASEMAARIDAPLGGAPGVVKDLFHIAGLPTLAGGSFIHEIRPTPTHDGALAAALRAAGASLAGKTHLHEFAYGLTGENLHHGAVVHPRFPDRTSGGSSSGSAAAVAAGIVPFSVGTDTGGSIRVPAAFCGLYGFRMTPHHAWIADGFPLAPSFDTAGFFTRDAADLRALLAAVVPGFPATAPSRELRGVFIGFGALGQLADPAVESACATAAARLAPSADFTIVGSFVEATRGAVDAYAVLQSTEAFAVHRDWLDRFRDRYEPGVWQRIDRGRRWTDAQLANARTVLARVRAWWAAYFESHDFLVLPATPFPALRQDALTLENRNRLLALTTPASLGGNPVLTIPLALPDSGGLTTGLQVVVARSDGPALPWALARCATCFSG